MNKSIKVAGLVALLCSAAAFAGDTDYSKLDTNGDGNISKDEAKADADIAANFDQMDTDKNGSLSDAELKADEKNRREKRREGRRD